MPRIRRKARPHVQVEPGDLPTPEQLMTGCYAREFVTHVETNTKAMSHINRGGSALCRWQASGKLDNTQLAVVRRCLEMWRLVGLHQRVTANYGERIPSSSETESVSDRILWAKEDLARYEGYFPGRTKEYFRLFENVIRHNEPAGLAGAVDGFDKKAATARALTVVRLVCDVIATHERF